MVSSVWTKWLPAVTLVILLGVLVWTGIQNSNQEETGTRSNNVVDWIETLDRNQPKDTQTATFALG